jgi:hypothetical protein
VHLLMLDHQIMMILLLMSFVGVSLMSIIKPSVGSLISPLLRSQLVIICTSESGRCLWGRLEGTDSVGTFQDVLPTAEAVVIGISVTLKSQQGRPFRKWKFLC